MLFIQRLFSCPALTAQYIPYNNPFGCLFVYFPDGRCDFRKLNMRIYFYFIDKRRKQVYN